MEFLKQLNDSQRKAVEYIDGASLVIAGAGSGKTRVLTYKIAYLLSQGYKPWEIMALTFTNKAAREMKERIITLVGPEARGLQMGTFHSVFARILRREALNIGYDSNFTIYDESDSRSLCKSIVKQLGLDDKVYKPSDVHNRISWAKNKLIFPTQYAGNGAIISADRDSKHPEMSTIYKMYMDSCRKSNAMDFDDLLLYTYKLFNDNEQLRHEYAQRFRFLLVDEYQDTNYAQQQIVWQIASDHKHVCVVGDDAQSIYGFRGANIDNILDFQQQYQGSQLFKLEQNYRSTQRIVQAANSLIRHNDRQIKKDVFSRNDEGEKLILRVLSSDKEEAISVCRDIKKGARSEGRPYSDFAILYRTNYQSRTFEEQLLKDNIPYRIYGGMSFYQRKEIKDIIAYFRLVANHNDDEAFRRIVNYPARGIGDTTVNRLIAAGQAFGESLWTISSNPGGYGVKINKPTVAKLIAFHELIEGFASRLDSDDAFTLGHDIIKQADISADIYSGTNPDDLSRQENLEEFVSSMQDFVEGNREEGLPFSLIDFLQDVSLMSDRDSEDDEDSQNRVTLMTIHSAKGLEFPVVFIVGMEENIFPSPMCTGSIRQLEEERRLLYVAITRAEQRCVLTCAKSRYRYGRMEFDAPSRFLKDIDRTLIVSQDTDFSSTNYRPSRPSFGFFNEEKKETTDRYGVSSRMQSSSRTENKTASMVNAPTGFTRVSSLPKTSSSPVAASPSSSQTMQGVGGTLSVGDRISHSRFGKGTVKGLDGSGDSAKATVEFDNAGTKQLLLKFAKIEKIG